MAGMHPLLEQTRAVLARKLAGCSPEQLAHHPGNDPARWNAWQIADHLAATWRSTARGLEDRLQKARPLKTRATLKQRIVQVAVFYCGYFPKRGEAPKTTLPSAAPPEPLTGDQLIAQLTATLAAMDALLDRLGPGSHGAPVLTHHLLGPLSVAGWRRFHRAHARHHAPQIERAVREQAGTVRPALRESAAAHTPRAASPHAESADSRYTHRP